MKTEKVLIPFNGYLVVVILLLSLAATLYGFISNNMILIVASLTTICSFNKGFYCNRTEQLKSSITVWRL